MRGIGAEAPEASAAAGAIGVVPATVTVNERVTPPAIVSVYVVVAFGVTLMVPRGGIAPMPLSIVAVPASVAQVKSKDSPGLIVTGFAWKLTIRGVIALRPPPRPPCPAAAPCAGA